MSAYSKALFASLMMCLILSGQSQAAPSEFRGRGVFHFSAVSDCATVENHCNRISLDVADAHASVDTQTHSIVIDADANHNSTLIGDVLLHGSGLTAEGQRVPLSLQVLLRRTGKHWKKDTYVHAPVRGHFSDIKLEPYQISVGKGADQQVLLTATQARETLAHPSLAARLASYFVVVHPTDANNPSADDITIGLGAGHLTKPLLRASFTVTPSDSTSLKSLLASGTWNLRLQSLSSLIPVWAVQHQLFLFGLEDSPLLSDVRKRGMNKHDILELGAVKGKGYLRYNGVEESFPAATVSGAAFMRESFMGLILSWHHLPQETP
ncbi:hypothetical protein C9426_17825 [Serratia sp. S1B]|nr:hypothetical protein C9426_17825 [Serratia sp. S1B]